MIQIIRTVSAVGIGLAVASSPFAISHPVVTTIISGYLMGVR